MKILFLARGIPSENDPQEGCFEWDQAKALLTLGHIPIVMALDAKRRKERRKWGITHFTKEGIEVYRIYGGTTTIVEHLISYKLALKINNFLTEHLYKRVITEHPDIKLIHAHYLRCISRAAIIGKKYNMPVVGTEHWSEIIRKDISKKIYSMGMSSYRNIDKLICVSEYLQKAIANKYNVNSVVCGNVLSTEFIDTYISSDRKASDIFSFISCGSLVPIKGYDIIIKAAAKLTIPRNKWKMEIIGGGPLRKELQALIDNLGLHDNIILKGQLEKRDIVDALRQSDTFVLGSRSETFGVVVIEALAMGVPVICTRCGGTDGLINKNNGQYIPIDDVEAMKDAMEYAYNNNQTYDRNRIREDCLERFSPTAIANKLIKIYNYVI